jgi:hypothetical protein
LADITALYITVLQADPIEGATRLKEIKRNEYFKRVHVFTPAAVKRIFQHSNGCFFTSSKNWTVSWYSRVNSSIFFSISLQVTGHLPP